MSKTLYDELGVERGASKERVKRAYRKKAKRVHPDVSGGDKEAFQRLQLAYDTLADDAARERYDRTGQAGGSGGSKRDKATAEMAKLIAIVAAETTDPSRQNILEMAREKVRHAMLNAKMSQSDAKVAANRLRQAALRFSVKADGAENFPAAVLLQGAERAEQAAALKQDELDTLEEALAVLAQFEYRTDGAGGWTRRVVSYGNFTVHQ